MSLLARNLDRERFDSHVIVLTHSGPIEEELRDAGIPLHFIEKRGKFDPGAIKRLRQKLIELDPDVVHTWLFAANSYGRWAAKSTGVPVVIAGERCVDPWKRFWHHAIDRQLAKSTDRIVTNTTAVVDFYGNHGLSKDRFSVIPNAVVMPEEQNSEKRLSREEVCRRLKIDPRGRIVGAVGRLWDQKGYEDLIWAGELLRVAYEDVWFVIIGDGPDMNKLQHFRDKVEAHHGVRFAGHREDARELMTGFDLLWNGSLYEGQSNTILEAMSNGVPVVASDIPGNRDLVVNGETGYLYPLGDIETLVRKSNALLKDPEAMQAMGEKAKSRIREKFSLADMVAKHEELYSELLDSKSK